MKMRWFVTAASLAGLILASCGKSGDGETGGASGDAAKGKPAVYVANYPLKYFAERIGGQAVRVVFPAPGDEDPAFWQPDDATVAAYQGADLILMNGATYSKWAEKTSLPSSKEVDTSAAFKGSFIVVKDSVTHSHGPGGQHSHSGTAFTTWIDFDQAAQQAQAVRDALVKLVPDQQAVFDAALGELKKDLAALDTRMQAVGKKIEGAPIVASHPVYQYWARRYGINLQAVLWEPEQVPDDKQMADLQALLAKHSAKWMVWEGEPARESVTKLDALGVKSVVFDPCGNVPDSGDFLSMMTTNVEAMEKAFP